ncbi:ABC transporter permease [Mesorhizobium sp. KR9-304]|uniref:ABC transporter permease n=1 Tax=Mesorhizobium sp. KR9-304 TaxID=3156614 RepID=UPI0032B4DB1D
MTSMHRYAWNGFGAAVIGFMLSPLVVLVVFCFSSSPLLTLPIEGWSLHWFADAFARPGFLLAFRNSLIVTVCVGATSTIIGTMAAMALSTMRPGLSVGLMLAVTVPIMAPPLLLGVALLTFYSTWLNLTLGLPTVILSHLVFTQPFVILVINARMASFDHAAVESARDLGAGPLRAFFDVTLPIIAPSVVGGALIAMALSLDDFLVTFFTIGGSNTLPTFMWGMLRKGVDPSINVVATLIMLLSIGTTVFGLRITQYRG